MNEPVMIDPAFSEEEIAIIIGVANEWFQSVPSARREVAVGTPATFQKGLPSSVPDGHVEAEDGRSGIVLGAASPHAFVAIRETVDAARLRTVALHEFGHYLGAWVHLEDGNVLAATATGWSDQITDADIEAVCEARQDCPSKLD